MNDVKPNDMDKMVSPTHYKLVDDNSDVSFNENMVEFNGDIIITDPSLVFDNDDDFETCDYGANEEEMRKLGFTKYLFGGFPLNNQNYNTLYCYADISKEKLLGTFEAAPCAVGIFLLSDIFQMDNRFSVDYLIRKNLAVVIRNFNGKIGIYEDKENKKICIASKGKLFIPII